MPGKSASLKRIADELLSDQEDDDRLETAARALYSLCASVTGIDEASSRTGDSDGTGLPDGKALSPRDAARCVLDFRRTSRFLRGIHAAILEARKRFPGTTVEILYAGCGPFAPLALPLTTRFSSTEIRFTLLDVHQRSLDAARLAFRAFGAAGFVRDYVRCDATSYRHPTSRDLHVVVVEAMQAALAEEPQVAITLNLAPQLRPGGIFIPESIAVDCHLCDPSGGPTLLPAEAAGGAGTHLGRVLELTAASGCGLPPSGVGEGDRGTTFLPKIVLHVPEDVDGEFHLMLLTIITVFGSVALDRDESGLTCPRILCDLGRVRGGMAVELTYHHGDSPGFRAEPLRDGGTNVDL